MREQQEKFSFLQIHIDAARNATDDFNAFHDPHKWDAIHGNPFESPIVLGFQLEALAESRVQLFREKAGEAHLAREYDLGFSNYQFSFADVVRPGEEIMLGVKPTVNRISTTAQIANRITVRKGNKLVILGHQRESRIPLTLPETDFRGMGDPGSVADRTFIQNGRYYLKRKFINTSNGKNFLAGSLVDQHHYFDELEDRVQFPGIFPVALLSCALLEKAKQEGYDFYKKPVVYTSHAISVDRQLLDHMKSNDPLHILVQGPEQVRGTKGLGRSDIPQTAYSCFGLVAGNRILFRAKVLMALLEDVIAAQQQKRSIYSSSKATA